MTGPTLENGVPKTTLAALMLSVFTVSIGYGIILPLLPFIIERLIGSTAAVSQVSRVTGLLTGLYALSLFLFAPLWGYLSDRFGRRAILLVGLIGLGLTTLSFAFIQSLVATYAERFLSGMFAAAVTPVALAAIGDLANSEQARGRHLTFISLAGISGFLLGPMLGVFIAHSASNAQPSAASTGSLALPLMWTAGLALVAASAAAMAVPGARIVANDDRAAAPVTSKITARLVSKLLGIAFVVSACVGVFEVGLALRGKQELGLSQYQIAVMFTECSVVMLVVQALVFSPWIKPETTRWLIVPALAALTFGMVLVPWASNFTLMLVVIAAVASSAGILSPILTYWISTWAGNAQGVQLGKQTSAASLGAAAGSVIGGVLFEFPMLPGAPFLLVAALAGGCVWLSLSLPRLLETETNMLGSAGRHDRAPAGRKL